MSITAGDGEKGGLCGGGVGVHYALLSNGRAAWEVEIALDWESRGPGVRPPWAPSRTSVCVDGCADMLSTHMDIHGDTDTHRQRQTQIHVDTGTYSPPDTHTHIPHAHTLTHSCDTQRCSFGQGQRQGKVSPQGRGEGGL